MAYYHKKSDGSKGTPRRDQRSHSGSPRSLGPRQSKRPVKKFDPSLFMKKVEEQTATAAYIPKNMFSDFLIEDQIKKNISDKGYITPTPIQDQVIPLSFRRQRCYCHCQYRHRENSRFSDSFD